MSSRTEQLQIEVKRIEKCHTGSDPAQHQKVMWAPLMSHSLENGSVLELEGPLGVPSLLSSLLVGMQR